MQDDTTPSTETDPRPDRRAPRVLLVIGPESTGTRILTTTLSQHPAISGSPDAVEHEDCLASVWRCLERGDVDAASSALRANEHPLILTRRSLPASARAGIGARFCDFADLDAFADVAARAGRSVTVFLTVRDPLANLASWVQSRYSTQGSLASAHTQYREAIAHAVDFVTRRDIPYLITPLEALGAGGASYVNGLFSVLGLEALDEVRYEHRPDVNTKHHAWIREQDFDLSAAVREPHDDRTAAFARLVDGEGRRVIQLAAYPYSIANGLSKCKGIVLLEPFAPRNFALRAWDAATARNLPFEFIPQNLATFAIDPQQLGRFALVAPNLEPSRGCATRTEIAHALYHLAHLVAASETAILEIPATQTGRIAAEFLAVALDAESDDVTDQIPEPAPIGGDSNERPHGERRVLRFPGAARCVDDAKVVALAETFASVLFARLHPGEPFEPAPYRMGETIDFNRSGAGRGYQVAGWSAPERRHTWTLGTESHIRLGIPGDAAPLPPQVDVDLVLECLAAVFPPQVPAQHLEVLVNGDVVFQGDFTERENDPLCIPVPGATWQRRAPVDIELRHPTAVSPAREGLGDGEREIAFGLISLKAERRNRTEPPPSS